MQTAPEKAGPHTYHSADPPHVLLIAFDHDIRATWPDYGYAVPPSAIRTFVEERYGNILDAHCFTRRRSTFERMPITRRNLTEARAWVEAGFIALHDLWDRKLIAAHLLRYVNLLRPDTVVCVGDTSISDWAIDALRARGLRVVVISPLPSEQMVPRKGEMLSLRDIATGNVPPLPRIADGDRFIEAWKRVGARPIKRPDSEILAGLEWRDPNLHAQIMRLLTLDTAGYAWTSFFRGVTYQFRQGRLPDIVLALLFILADAPEEDGDNIRVDRKALATKLGEYGVKRQHDVAMNALLILHETGDLLKETDAEGSFAFFYARTVRDWLAHRFAGSVSRKIEQLWKTYVQKSPGFLATGTAFLDACVATMEILVFNRGGLTPKGREYLRALDEFLGRPISSRTLEDLSSDELRSLDWNFNAPGATAAFRRHDVTNLDDIGDFAGRMKSLLADFALESIPTSEEEDAATMSGLRQIPPLPAEEATPPLKTAS